MPQRMVATLFVPVYLSNLIESNLIWSHNYGDLSRGGWVFSTSLSALIHFL